MKLTIKKVVAQNAIRIRFGKPPVALFQVCADGVAQNQFGTLQEAKELVAMLRTKSTAFVQGFCSVVTK